MFRATILPIFGRIRLCYTAYSMLYPICFRWVIWSPDHPPATYWVQHTTSSIIQSNAPVPILSQLHPVSTTPSHFLKIYLNIIFPSTSGSPQWSLYLRFPHQNPMHTSPLPHTRHMPLPSHSSRFYHLHNLYIT